MMSESNMSDKSQSNLTSSLQTLCAQCYFRWKEEKIDSFKRHQRFKLLHGFFMMRRKNQSNPNDVPTWLTHFFNQTESILFNEQNKELDDSHFLEILSNNRFEEVAKLFKNEEELMAIMEFERTLNDHYRGAKRQHWFSETQPSHKFTY